MEKVDMQLFISKILLHSAVLLASLCSTTACAVETLYVKPSIPSTVCPSGDSPCHSLQYYADHSTFTNNSMFLFLKGEHHLNSVVEIRNVVNLSLAGSSVGVVLFCESLPSGFYIEKFKRLVITNLTIYNCEGVNNTAVYLKAGSEVRVGNVSMISNGSNWMSGLNAIDVVGTFSILDSLFSTPHGGNILVKYSHCSRPSSFIFSGNKLTTAEGIELHLRVVCSNVEITIADNLFENIGMDADTLMGLSLYFGVLNDNLVTVNNNILWGGLSVTSCTDSSSCTNKDLRCNHSLKFSRNIAHSHTTIKIGSKIPTKECIIFIEDMTFHRFVIFTLGYDSSKNRGDRTVQVVLRNATFADNPGTQLWSPLRLVRSAALLVNCIFENNSGSALVAHSSKVVFEGTNTFRNNSALIGGGIQLLNFSYMYLEPYARISFENNHANHVGGAIYIEYKYMEYPYWCFFYSRDTTARVKFVNNTSDYAGSSIYGEFTTCCNYSGGPFRSCRKFSQMFRIFNTDKDPSAVASDPYSVCLCKEDEVHPSCSLKDTHMDVHAFPGQAFTLRLAVLGIGYNFLNGLKLDGIVPGAIRAILTSSNAALGEAQSSQLSELCCQNFSYSILTRTKTTEITLMSEQAFLNKMVHSERFEEVSHTVSLTVNLKDCPPGFILAEAGKCVCHPIFSRHNIECFINEQSILRPANSWIGFVYENASTSPGVMFQPNCPVTYCFPEAMNISINTSSSQCEPHRTGLLCGKCEEGYSLTLGNGICRKCSNTYLLLILPIAVSGLLWVAVLFVFNVTVSEGIVNGLVFYANVISLNHDMLFTKEMSYPYMFIAWLNLDLGINTCLYDGMNSYAETWLQFVYPIYLWMIILAITQFYKKFATIANRLGGEKAVKVLATLLLLSYTKLQRTVVTILSFTKLEYPDGSVRYVWLYDANVEFFKGKHLYLGIAGILILIFLIVPYTLCLAFFQQLQAYSHHRPFQWVNQLKPVLDAYAGPYKDKYRFWTGMLLVFRTLLVILFTVNTTGSVDFNLLIILVVSCTLLTASANGIYKKWYCNFLESFFHAQLLVFTGGIVYARHNHGSTTVAVDTSIGITLAVVLALLLYSVVCLIMTIVRKITLFFSL